MARRRQLVAPQERETPAPIRRTPDPLVVGDAGDAAEREADRVADQVLARLQGAGHDHDCTTAHAHGVARTPSAVPSGAEVGAAGGELSGDLSERIQAGRRGGTALSGAVRERMEAGFGESLGDVRIHTGPDSADLNRSVSARAFTVGRDVFFGAGEYRPDTPEGERVLAHELAHTRQEGAAARRTIRRYDISAPRIDWSRTVTMSVIGSGQSVYFLEDADGERIAVKAERQNIGLADLAGRMHESLSGVSSVKHRPLDLEDIAAITGILAQDAKLGGTGWAQVGATKKADRRDVNMLAEHLRIDADAVRQMPDEDIGRIYHRFRLDGERKMMAMSFAQGDTAAKTASKKGTDPRDQGESNRLRGLLTDYKHLQHLGLLTAVDLFMGNEDRVYSGNLGNWFYDPESEAMTVIDHVDPATAGVFGGRETSVPLLARTNLGATTSRSAQSLADGAARAGDTEFPAWLDGEGGARRKRMEEALERGLVDGRKLVVKTFTSTRFSGSSKARAVKKSIKKAGREATAIDRNEDRDDYYKTLKRRAEWLKKH